MKLLQSLCKQVFHTGPRDRGVLILFQLILRQYKEFFNTFVLIILMVQKLISYSHTIQFNQQLNSLIYHCVEITVNSIISFVSKVAKNEKYFTDETAMEACLKEKNWCKTEI